MSRQVNAAALSRLLDQKIAALSDGAAKGLAAAAEHVLGESNRIIPIDEGDLARSGATAVDRENLVAAIGYSAEHAVVQHEDLTLRHTNGREAKFLEKTLQAEARTARDLIAAEVRKALGT